MGAFGLRWRIPFLHFSAQFLALGLPRFRLLVSSCNSRCHNFTIKSNPINTYIHTYISSSYTTKSKNINKHARLCYASQTVAPTCVLPPMPLQSSSASEPHLPFPSPYSSFTTEYIFSSSCLPFPVLLLLKES